MENKNLYNYFSISNYLQKPKNQPNNHILRLKLEVSPTFWGEGTLGFNIKLEFLETSTYLFQSLVFH